MHSILRNVSKLGSVAIASEVGARPLRSNIGVFSNLVTLIAYDTDMASVFTRIINSELPSHMFWSDPHCVGFLSINPLTEGHALVVPRQQIDHWLDLSADTVAHLMKVSHHIGSAINSVFTPERVAVMIAGFEVPHTHIHVLGIDSEADMNFANAAQSVDHEQLAGYAAQIREALIELGHEDFASATP